MSIFVLVYLSIISILSIVIFTVSLFGKDVELTIISALLSIGGVLAIIFQSINL